MKKLIAFLMGIYVGFAMSAHANEKNEIVPCEGSNYFNIKDETTNRLPFSSLGDTLQFKLPSDTTLVTVSEEKRKSRAAEELQSIMKAILGKVSMQVIAPEETRCTKYVQRYKRSTIKVNAFNKNKEEIAVSKSLIAGPAEHIYFSADIPVTNIKQLTYDTATSSIIEKEKPATFYVGINWQLGDVYTDYPSSLFYKNFSIKTLFKASSRPSESMGIGLAYSFDAVDVFAARIRTKDDASVGGAGTGSTDATVYGVSFNITKGLEWFK